jgi:molecular chaperone GrpE
LIDEGPLPEEDIAAELAEEQATEEAATAGRASADQLRQALADQNERYLRLAAEFDNFRRRTNKERLELTARAQAALAASLLGSLDDFARVTALKPEGSEAASVVEGVDLVARKLTKALTSAGLEPVNPVDETFDPQLHEAVATQPAANPDEDDKIASVYQPGYLFKGQLLRPAQVVVKKWKE